MTTAESLQEVFYNNFTAYYRSHVAHVNVTGRNFASDHKLLQKVYEDLPCEIQFVLDQSTIGTGIFEGDSIELITGVRNDLDTLKDFYDDLMLTAEAEGHQEIANYAQDRILALAKHIWMLDATLE